METIEDRAYKYYPKAGIVDGTGRYAYIKGAKEQQNIDIEKFVEYAKSFNKQNEELGIEARIDVKYMRRWVSSIICGYSPMEIPIEWKPTEHIISDFEQVLKGE